MNEFREVIDRIRGYQTITIPAFEFDSLRTDLRVATEIVSRKTPNPESIDRLEFDLQHAQGILNFRGLDRFMHIDLISNPKQPDDNPKYEVVPNKGFELVDLKHKRSNTRNGWESATYKFKEVSQER